MNFGDKQLIQRLNDADISKIKRFSFSGLNTFARVIKVHDADTITIIFEYNGEIIKYNIRIDGIDAPELHSKKKEEMDLSKKGKSYVSKLILYSIVRVRFKDFDKYGRILGDIFIFDEESHEEQNLASILIRGGYVREYEGGKKEEWDL